MNVLVTGAKGFVGRNLCEALKNLRDCKDRTRPGLKVDDLYEYDVDSDVAVLVEYCRKADFVFNLAGVNRPKDSSEFMKGNYGFASTLIEALKSVHNYCPVMMSSSIQAALDNPYGRSKKSGEQLMFGYAEETGAKVFVYRFPNIFGKWCRPKVVHDVTLGEIVDLLGKFHAQPSTLILPDIPVGSFAKKLYSTYQSYLPKEKIPIPLEMHIDARGSFTELMKTKNSGQFSINISKPGITKGQHWHHSKWEMFIVVSGHALIQERKIGTDEVIEYEVSGDKMEAYQMLPGYTHNLINLSDTEDLVTIVWANESFDQEHPDTFFEKVKE